MLQLILPTKWVQKITTCSDHHLIQFLLNNNLPIKITVICTERSTLNELGTVKFLTEVKWKLSENWIKTK